MNIHLIRSSEVSKEFYDSVYEIVNRFSGPLKFLMPQAEIRMDADEITENLFNKKVFNKKQDAPEITQLSIDSESRFFKTKIPVFPKIIKSVKWSSLFKQCQAFRKSNKVNENDYVILLTNLANESNWFAAGEPNGTPNFFIHTDQWEFYLPCDPVFPVAFEVVVMILHRLMFDNYLDMKPHLHEKPRGCVNDFCQNKKDITFKLRTADICNDCQQLILKKNIDPSIINQVISIIEDIRKQMLFRERFVMTKQLSRVCVKGSRQRIFFTDLSNAELNLTPLERLVYLLFLKNNQGLHYTHVIDHEDWLKETYLQIGNGTLANMHNSVKQLVDRTENSLSEKISKIKYKLEQLAGKDLAENYTINGNRSEIRLIKFDRSLLSYEPKWSEN